MNARFLFVGHEPSATARRRGWTWRDGRLAAKQLFDALRSANIAPSEQWYANIVDEGCVPLCRHAAITGLEVVAMGLVAHRFLVEKKIPHRLIAHPAARGAIRRKAVYAQHVAYELGVCA